MTPFQGFLPDLDPTTPGVLKEVSEIIPTEKGFKAAPSASDAGLGDTSVDPNSLAVLQALDGNRRTFVGTATTIEEVVSGAWIDRTRAVGGAYTCSADARWSFAVFGNVSLAANVGDVIQASSTGGFSDISGSPQAAHIAVSEGFVMAANLSSNADGWHCSAYLDHTDWTESVSTQSTSGRLVGGGEITGLKKLGSGFVVFKNNSMYVASYVGAPVVFQWDEVPGDVGCPTGNAAVDIGDRIAFLGHDDFYIFDGARPVPIGKGIREWFFETVDNTYLYKTIATYNNASGNVTWHFPINGSALNCALVYNVRTGKWGKFEQTVLAAANYYPAGVIIDGATTDLSDLYATIDDMTDISFDSPFWSAGTANAGIIKSDGKLYTLTGLPNPSTITMNTFGDDEQYSTVTRVRPRFYTAPITSSIDYSYDDTYGDAFTDKGTFELINGKYDLLHSARWHQVKFNFTGNMEINGARVSLEMSGTQ